MSFPFTSMTGGVSLTTNCAGNARLNTLTLTGELWTYLADLNEQAQERLDTIIEQMKAAEGVTEELKRTCQMEWVQRCNNIHNRAEEIVLHEMIYS